MKVTNKVALFIHVVGMNALPTPFGGETDKRKVDNVLVSDPSCSWLGVITTVKRGCLWKQSKPLNRVIWAYIL